MGHSVTSFKSVHVTAKDWKVELWLRLLAYEIDVDRAAPGWARDAAAYWKKHADGYVNGCLDPQLDRWLTDRERVTFFRTLVSRVCGRLTDLGDTVTKSFLDSLFPQGVSPFNMPIRSDTLLAVGSALQRLIAGDIVGHEIV